LKISFAAFQAGWFGEGKNLSSSYQALEWSAKVIEDALNWVKITHNAWQVHDGADHFVMMATDRGRCDGALLVPDSVLGSSVILTTQMELDLRKEYQQAAEVRFRRCFHHGRDISIPWFFDNGTDKMPVLATTGERPILALLRFSDKLQSPYGPYRSILLQSFANTSAFMPHQVRVGLASYEVTSQDMKHSIFCLAPPGHTQDSSRLYRAIFNGCIPVTFFSNVDPPYLQQGVRWDEFSINIGLPNLHNTDLILRSVLGDWEQVEALQRGVTAVQQKFNWDRASIEGVQAQVVRKMQSIASHVHRDFD